MVINRHSFLRTFIFLTFPTLGAFAQAPSPGGVSGDNTIWLKANAGTTLNAANAVTVWQEQSGAGLTGDFSTQGATIGHPLHQPPLYQQGGINFNPYILFNSTTTPNSTSSGNAVTGTQILNVNNNTVFQVIRLHTMTGTGVWLKWQWQTNPYGGPRLGNEVNNGSNPGQIRLDFKSNNLYSTGSIAEKNVIYTTEINATTKSIRLDGLQNASNAVSGSFSPGTTPGRFTLGAEPYGDEYPTKIDIAEVILYARSLTPAERNKVESYLAVKYGFTLVQTGTAPNDYTASNAANIWSNAGNSPYFNNITGIGRDDASALHQKQSKSINARALVTAYKGNYTGTFPFFNEVNNQGFTNDLNYLLYGDNLADTLVKVCGPDGRFARMARIWKTQVLGAPVSTTLVLKKSEVPPDTKALLVASDPGFSTGLSWVPLSDNGAQLYATYTFSSGQYFSFGSEPMELNGDVGPIVCDGNTGKILLHPTGGAYPLQFAWNSTPPQSTQDLELVPPGTYTVTVTQANGCSFSETYTIIGSPSNLRLRTIDTVNTLCGGKNGRIQVEGYGGTPSYLYAINNGNWDITKSFDNLSAGTHVLSVKDHNDCMYDTAVTLSNYTYELTVDNTFENAWCDAGGLGGSITVTAEGGTFPYGYKWDPLENEKSNKAINLPKGRYKVTVTDRYGCKGTTSAQLEENSCCELRMPNAFTPNNDGKNDVFQAVRNRSIPDFELSIYNRWGQRVFRTNKDTEGWTGVLENGTAAEVGTYFYRLRYKCEKGDREYSLQGDLTLIR